MHQHNYFHGYPDRIRRDLINQYHEGTREQIGCVVVFGLLLSIFGYATWGLWQWIESQDNGSRTKFPADWALFWIGFFLSMMFGSLFIIGLFAIGRHLIIRLRRHLQRQRIEDEWTVSKDWRIVPCFECPLNAGWKNAATAGSVIAHMAEKLDGMAQETGIPSLSGLGLDDDINGKLPVWRDSEEGISTLNRLCDVVKATNMEEKNKIQVLAELEAILEVLNFAKQKRVHFCLCIVYALHPLAAPKSIRQHNPYFG